VFDPVDLLVAVGATGADVVIHNWDGAADVPSIYTHLFDQYPAVKVIRLSPNHQQALLYRRAIVASHFPSAMDSLISAILHSPPPALPEEVR
jgi:hypothetical protein